MPTAYPTVTAAILAILAAAGLGAGSVPDVIAADLPAPAPAVAPPPFVGPHNPYIWGAIAFSRLTGRHGIFWGGATRAEATQTALLHCARAGGADCAIVSEFVSYRDAAAPFARGPAPSCGALSVTPGDPGPVRSWGAAVASTRVEAEQEAVQRCGGPQICTIRETVCT